MINLLLTDDSLPIGGKEKMILGFLKKIDRSRFKVHFATLTSTGVLIHEARAYADDYYCVGRRSRLDLFAVRRLRKYINTRHIQMVHCNQMIDSTYVYFATIGLRVKRISAVHGNTTGWRDFIFKSILSRFDLVISVSNSARNQLINRGYSAHNMIVIHNGIEIKDYEQPQPTLHSKELIIIGMIGNFRRERDHLTLCRAAKYLLHMGRTNFEIRIIGGAIHQECERDVRRYCRKHALEDHIRFLGVCFNIIEQLLQLDIYVASSRLETFGIALVEAMACRLPVVVSRIPAFMEVVEFGKYGLHFEVGDYVQLAQRIAELMDDVLLRREYGELAHARSLAFSVNSSIGQIEAAYETLDEVRKGCN